MNWAYVLVAGCMGHCRLRDACGSRGPVCTKAYVLVALRWGLMPYSSRHAQCAATREPCLTTPYGKTQHAQGARPLPEEV